MKWQNLEVMPLQNTTPLYKDLDIPFRKFLRAKFHNDFTDIEDFDNIYLMFVEAIGGIDVIRNVNNLSQYQSLLHKVKLFEISLNLYTTHPTEELYNIIVDFGYNNFEEGFARDRASVFVEQMKQQVGQDVITLQSMAFRHNKAKETVIEETETDYYNLLKAMEICFGHYIPDSINMREFCSYLVSYRLKTAKTETE